MIMDVVGKAYLEILLIFLFSSFGCFINLT